MCCFYIDISVCHSVATYLPTDTKCTIAGQKFSLTISKSIDTKSELLNHLCS